MVSWIIVHLACHNSPVYYFLNYICLEIKGPAQPRHYWDDVKIKSQSRHFPCHRVAGVANGWCITSKKNLKKGPRAQTFRICRRTANRVVIDGLTHTQSSNVSRAFPPENQILNAFVKIYQLYLRLSTDVL